MLEVWGPPIVPSGLEGSASRWISARSSRRLTDLRFTRTNRDALKYSSAISNAAVRVGCNRLLGRTPTEVEKILELFVDRVFESRTAQFNTVSAVVAGVRFLELPPNVERWRS